MIVSVGISLYLIFVVVAGFANLFRFPWADLFYPWSNFGMFAAYPASHLELDARGFTREGHSFPLPIEDFFPMPRTLIARGEGFGIGVILIGLAEPWRTRGASRLCTYLLAAQRRREGIFLPSSTIIGVTVSFVSWPLGSGPEVKRETPLATCFSHEEYRASHSN